jgi:putative aldouronate transport system permease protein
MIMTILAAYPLSKKRLKGRNIFLLIIVITMYFGGGLIPNYILVKGLNLRNTIWSLILPGMLSSFNMIILKTFFTSSIPDSLEESAYLDGCGDFRVLIKIILPLSMPVLATLSLFYAVARWNGFMDALMYIDKPKLYPLQLKLWQIVYNNMTTEAQEGSTTIQQVTSEGLKAACVVFATLPILLLYPWLQKYFVQGVMIGAVKG